MKRRELVEHLERNGCRLEREGSRHIIFFNPVSRAKSTVPRHTEIDNRLANKICKQLGVSAIRGN